MSMKLPDQQGTERRRKAENVVLPATLEGMLEYIAERIRLGKDVRRTDLKVLHNDVAPASTDSRRIRVKTEPFPFCEWLLDNVFQDTSVWSQEIGTGGYFLSDVSSLSRISESPSFEVEGHFFVLSPSGEYISVQPYNQRHFIAVQIEVLIETRIDVIVTCYGPRSVSVLWDAYKQIVDQIASRAKTLDRQAEPYAHEGDMVYLHRRKPNPEILKRNADIRAAADAGTRLKDLAQRYGLSINTIKSILREERKKRPVSR